MHAWFWLQSELAAEFHIHTAHTWPIPLTLSMLRLPSSKAQGCRLFYKLSKPCHVGIHWIALTECFPISTHVPGFQSFFSFFASFCNGRIIHQQHKGYGWKKYTWQPRNLDQHYTCCKPMLDFGCNLNWSQISTSTPHTNNQSYPQDCWLTVALVLSGSSDGVGVALEGVLTRPAGSPTEESPLSRPLYWATLWLRFCCVSWSCCTFALLWKQTKGKEMKASIFGQKQDLFGLQMLTKNCLPHWVDQVEYKQSALLYLGEISVNLELCFSSFFLPYCG